MAPTIAKRQVVGRVILFSSPWDFVTSNGKVRTLAPWLAMPGTTPPERWFGGYHARENEAGLLGEVLCGAPNSAGKHPNIQTRSAGVTER